MIVHIVIDNKGETVFHFLTEMTFQSEVPTDILIQDLSMTNRTDITHIAGEGILSR